MVCTSFQARVMSLANYRKRLASLSCRVAAALDMPNTLQKLADYSLLTMHATTRATIRGPLEAVLEGGDAAETMMCELGP